MKTASDFARARINHPAPEIDTGISWHCHKFLAQAWFKPPGCGYNHKLRKNTSVTCFPVPIVCQARKKRFIARNNCHYIRQRTGVKQQYGATFFISQARACRIWKHHD